MQGIAHVVVSRPGEDASEGYNACLDLAKMIPGSKILSFWWMENINSATKDALISEDEARHITDKTGADQLMKPTASFAPDRVYHHMQVKLSKQRFLHSQESFSIGEVKNVPGRHGPGREKKDVTDLTVDSYDSDDIRQDLLIRQSQKGKEVHHTGR